MALGANPLPVELISFTVQKLDDQSLITWETASEIQNEYFLVERSIDQLNFEVIGKVLSQGNSNTSSSYEFVDSKPAPGVNYYRLKQKKFDGSIEFSDLRVIEFDKDDFLEVQESIIYPNPGKLSKMKLILSKSFDQLELRNALGELILLRSLSENIQEFNFSSFPELSPGNYTISLSGISKVEHHRIVIH